MLRIFLSILALITINAQAFALTVKDVRFGVHSDKTRMVIETDSATQFRAFMLPKTNDNPYRLVIDMPDFDWQAGTIAQPKKTEILDVRAGTLQAGIKRLVVDLNKPANIKTAFLLPASNTKPNRLVIDFNHISAKAFAGLKHEPIGSLKLDDIGSTIVEVAKTDPAPKAMLQEQPKIVEATSPTPTPISPLRRPLIVVDAGHGGADPGAIGAGKQKEKDITLSAARTLKKRLENTGRYRVHLTRDNDKYIKLSKRRSIARTKEADLFISLHADSINKSNVRGASIYTLSNKASDAQTAKLAARENQSDLIAGVDLSHEDKDVANILLDLAMRDTMNQSKFFANIVVDNMGNRGMRILTRPHRYAGFAVLKSPDVPSVLVEMGFMSNKSEALLLSSASYQNKVAAALTDSIDQYFKKITANNR